MNKKRIELLKACRYYHGEEDSPFEERLSVCNSLDLRKELELKHWFWTYEQIWVGSHYSSKNYLQQIEEEGKQLNLENLLPKDNTPLSLKALLHNRHLKDGGTLESFKLLYKEYRQSK